MEKKRRWDVAENEASVTDPPPQQQPSTDPRDIAAQAAQKINELLADKTAAKTTQPKVYTEEIEINNSPARYMLTRGTTQSQIQDETGAAVITRGRFKGPGDEGFDDRALHLYISADTKQSLDSAVSKIRDLMDKFSDSSDPYAAGPPTESRIVSDKVMVGIDTKGLDRKFFNLHAKILGPRGQYVKYIGTEAGAKVHLRGQGSGFYERPTNEESSEPMHLFIQAHSKQALEKAKGLAENLLERVRADYKQMSERAQRPPPIYGGQYGHGYHQMHYHGGQQFQTPPPPPQQQFQQQQQHDPHQQFYSQQAQPAPPAPPAHSSYPAQQNAYAQYPDVYGQQAYQDSPTDQPPPPPPPSNEPRRRFTEDPNYARSSKRIRYDQEAGPMRPTQQDLEASGYPEDPAYAQYNSPPGWH